MLKKLFLFCTPHCTCLVCIHTRRQNEYPSHVNRPKEIFFKNMERSKRGWKEGREKEEEKIPI